MSSQGRDLNASAIPGQVEQPHRPIDVGPFPPKADALDSPEDPLGPAASESKSAVASQWQLMRWKFKKHKLAVFSLWILVVFYGVALFAEVLAPANPEDVAEKYKYLSPQGLSFFDQDGNFSYGVALFAEVLAPANPEDVAEKYKYLSPQGLSFFDQDGNFSLRPGVNGLTSTRNKETLRVTYVADKSKWYPLYLFPQSAPYTMWGFIHLDRHLFGLGPEAQAAGAPLYLVGSDRQGRDMLSRIIYGTRISLSIGLLSVIVSLVLGIALGGVSGYYGGWIDNVIQRVIEFIRSLPRIPIWLAIAAALPTSWSSIQIFFVITLILSLLSWTGLARVVRGRFLSLREEDFVMAARFCGASEPRIIFRHMVPSFLSHIIASLTLAIPQIIIFETALSFLGLGLRPPEISWGVLLQEAQNVQTVAISPWLLLPGLVVVIAVLAFNFLGDGMRDAADPYSR